MYLSWWDAINSSPDRNFFDLPIVAQSVATTVVPAVELRCDWRVFRDTGGGNHANVSSGGSQIFQRLRLAGTFCIGDGLAEGEIRKAVLDDLKQKDQHIVGENDFIDDLRVEKIYGDRVTICQGDERVDLRLLMGQQATPGTNTEKIIPGDSMSNSTEQAIADGQVIQTNRFGSQIGQTRWMFTRKPIMDYYQLMMDNPDRMAKVFDTLKPLYDVNRKITGYKVGIEGEADFFADVGLRENDIVRSVNSLPMTNRRRAIFFINEFVNERANVFVLDVERNGKAEKLIYQIQ